VAQFCGDCAERAGQLAAMHTYRAATWDEHFAAVDEWLPRFAGADGRADSPARGNQARPRQTGPRELEASC
jgi:hypothetical protein